MDGHRRYADEPEPSWYSGQGQYTPPAPNPYDSGVHERPSGAFRLPEQRESYSPSETGSHARPPVESPSQEQVRIPVRGPEYPAVRPSGATSLADVPPAPNPAPATYGGNDGTVAAYNDPTSVVPPVTRFARGESRPADSVYRTRRPVSALVVAAGTAVLMIPTIMLLIQATFADDVAARGIVPAVLLTLGLPLTGAGLYALAGGGPTGREAWLRPPAVYLPVGLVMLVAAGLAVA